MQSKGKENINYRHILNFQVVQSVDKKLEQGDTGAGRWTCCQFLAYWYRDWLSVCQLFLMNMIQGKFVLKFSLKLGQHPHVKWHLFIYSCIYIYLFGYLLQCGHKGVCKVYLWFDVDLCCQVVKRCWLEITEPPSRGLSPNTDHVSKCGKVGNFSQMRRV